MKKHNDIIQDLGSMRYRINPSAFLVKGASRSMICDLGRSLFQLIPNTLYEILQDKEIDTIQKAVEKYTPGNEAHQAVVMEYYETLIEHDLIFFSNYPELYNTLSLEWDSPAQITNAIIDLDENSTFDFIDVVHQLAELGCRNIQIRSYSFFYASSIEALLASVNATIIESIQFIVPFVSDDETEALISLSKIYPRIRFIQLYNANKQAIIYSNKDQSTNIVSVKSSLTNEACCGVISKEYFSVAMTTFTESQEFNTCLNRKISVDRTGNIKECPSMATSYGNVRNTSLEQALQQNGIKKYWGVSKDQIETCKDCEFRHICTDCRAYTEDPENMYAKPLKCGYNPYTCEWENWSSNPLKQQAITFYGMRTVLPEFELKPDYVPARPAFA